MSESNFFTDTPELVGVLPMGSMLITSLYVYFHAQLAGPDDDFEAVFQAISGGMMLGAVSSELFPLVKDHAEAGNFGGLTIGLAAGVAMIYLLAWQDQIFVEGGKEDLLAQAQAHEAAEAGGHGGGYQSLGDNDNSANGTDIELAGRGKGGGNHSAEDDDASVASGEDVAHLTVPLDQWHINADELSNTALLGPWGKEREKIEKMHSLVQSMASKSRDLTTMSTSGEGASTTTNGSGSGSGSGSGNERTSLVKGVVDASNLNRSDLSLVDAETIADSLDEDLHQLEYYVHHFRRVFLEGSVHVLDVVGNMPAKHHLISRRRAKDLGRGVNALYAASSKIFDAFQLAQKRHADGTADDALDSLIGARVRALKVIHLNLKRMNSRLDTLHTTVDRASFRFKRRKASLEEGVMPEKGSTIPMSLVVPVVIDCMVDGFLIGLSSSLSRRTGLILALVTCVEMGFLGAAFSLRIKKCDGSSKIVRSITIVLPPLVIFAMVYVGSAGGESAINDNFWLSSFVGFAIVALVQLSCSELLCEAFAKGGQSGSLLMVLGIWLTLMFDRVVPNDGVK